MPKFGTISLFDVAGGATSELQAAKINLIIGPNGSGKSLFLRELSGCSPRVARYRRHSHPQPRVLIRSAAWSEDYDALVKRQAVDEALPRGGFPFEYLHTLEWHELLDSLNRVATSTPRLLNEVSSQLSSIVGDKLPPDLVALVKGAIKGADQEDIGTLSAVLGGGAVLLAEFDPKSTERGAIGAEDIAKVRDVLRVAWRSWLEALGSFGLDPAEVQHLDLFHDRLLFRIAMGLFGESGLVPLLSSTNADVEILAPVDQDKAVVVKEAFSWLMAPSRASKLIEGLQEAYRHRSWEEPSVLSSFTASTLYLDCIGRLHLAAAGELRKFHGDGSEPAPPVLELLKRPESRAMLRELTEPAIGLHVVVDMVTNAPNVLLRVAREAPPSGVEGAYTESASEYFEGASPLEAQSDGIQAYVGMMAAIVVSTSECVFIDEPEAFLHPPLVRHLARNLSSLASRAGGRQFFVATHSSELLAAVAASGVEANILRFSPSARLGHARLLDTRQLQSVALDPYLRNTRTLDALFQNGAVVCEGEGDRLLYQEINERLLNCTPTRGCPSTVFLSAYGWQAVPRMVGPLREMGVAAACILDADTIMGSEFANILDCAQVPRGRREAWLMQRASLKQSIKNRLGSKEVCLERETLAQLSDSERHDLADMCADLRRYGIFVVPVGELEDWLSSLSNPAKKTNKRYWLECVLKALGGDPASDDYVRAGTGDIWEFIEAIAVWLMDAKRRGCERLPQSA